MDERTHSVLKVLNTIILNTNFVLFQVFLTVILSVGVGSLSAAIAALTGTHIIRPIISLISCSYDKVDEECVCTSNYKRDILILEVSDEGTQSNTMTIELKLVYYPILYSVQYSMNFRILPTTFKYLLKSIFKIFCFQF